MTLTRHHEIKFNVNITNKNIIVIIVLYICTLNIQVVFLYANFV